MAKIPFDIKYRPQIESGEYIVIDRFNYKLHFVKEEDGVFFFTVRYPGCNYDTERLYDHPERHLFITAPKEELTEFEKKLWDVLKSEGSPIGPIEKFTNADKEVFHSYAAELLALAREQLVKDGYVIEKKAFHDAVEKCDPEVMKEVSENIGQLSEFEFALRNAFADTSVLTDGKDDEEQSEIADKQAKRYAPELLALAEKEIAKGHEHDVYIPEDTYYEQLKKQWEEGYDNGKAAALKDLPRWGDNWDSLHPYKDISGLQYIVLNGKAINVSNLSKLPGFKEDEK